MPPARAVTLMKTFKSLQLRQKVTQEEQGISFADVVILVVTNPLMSKIGALGHPFVKTPHLDRLAQTSAIFTNAYTSGLNRPALFQFPQ